MTDSPPAGEVPAYDALLDERGHRCPLPVIALARAFAVDDAPVRVLLLSDDPASVSDVPAWCGLRGKALEWVGPAPDGSGSGYLVTTP